MMKKLLGIVVLGLLWCNLSYSHPENKNPIFLECTGVFPQELNNSDSGSRGNHLVKIDLRKSKIVFHYGVEYVSKTKWNTSDLDFVTYSGTRKTESMYIPSYMKEHFWVDRFTGKATFFYTKKKNDDPPTLPPKSVQCKKIERKF